MGGQIAGRQLAHAGNDGKEHVFAGPSLEKIELGEHNAVCNRHLLHRFRMGIQCRHAIEAIDDGDHTFKPEPRQNTGFAHHGMQNRGWIGQTRRLNDYPVKGLDAAFVPPAQQIMERIDEITPDGTAQAAG